LNLDRTRRLPLATPGSGASIPGKKFPLDMAENSAIFKDVDDVAPDQPPSTPDSAASFGDCRSLSGTAASVYPAATLLTSAAALRLASVLRHGPPGLAN